MAWFQYVFREAVWYSGTIELLGSIELANATKLRFIFF